VIAAAFACDLVRVATIAFEDQDAGDCGGRPGTSLHNDYSHSTTDRNSTGGDPMADEVMTQASVNHAGHVASLLDSLAAVRESDGSTLLDHTLVVWTSELAVGRHEGTRAYYGLPFILAGSDEHLRMGRYVKLTEDVPVEITGARTTRYTVGPSHNHLLVSLCHAAGADDVTSVGMESISLPGGVTLDATGPLPGLARA
jgi:hypothetical protein